MCPLCSQFFQGSLCVSVLFSTLFFTFFVNLGIDIVKFCVTINHYLHDDSSTDHVILIFDGRSNR